MKQKLISLLLLISIARAQQVEAITEEELQKMIEAGQIEVVQSQGGAQVY